MINTFDGISFPILIFGFCLMKHLLVSQTFGKNY